jgi:heme/copper-type cytochrome/quinol oxidase subunit 2
MMTVVFHETLWSEAVMIAFIVLLVLTSSVFLFLWVLHLTSLWRKPSGKRDVTAVIWTVIPGIILIGLGIIGPFIVRNLQNLS